MDYDYRASRYSVNVILSLLSSVYPRGWKVIDSTKMSSFFSFFFRQCLLILTNTNTILLGTRISNVSPSLPELFSWQRHCYRNIQSQIRKLMLIADWLITVNVIVIVKHCNFIAVHPKGWKVINSTKMFSFFFFF